jgi:biopolymer transport protein ExbD
MAMSVGNEDAGGDAAPMADINTTPLVDVMLVLLIIFLITVPAIIETVPLKLPKVANIPTTTKPENVVLSVKAEGGNCEVYRGKQLVPTTNELIELGADALRKEIERQRALGATDATLQLPEAHFRADANTPYRCVGGAIFAMQRAGFVKVAFISEPPEGSGSRF